jgi:hypothetical protein
MSLEISIYVTTFALIGASLLLGRKRHSSPTTAAAEVLPHPEIAELVRATLLFSRTVTMAHC